MIVIDWWSPEPHAEFNKNLYAILKNASKIYIFNIALASSCGKTVIIKNTSNRFLRALLVFKICWKHRHSRLIFASYDDLFIPFIQLYVKKIFCYEHNTTPDYIVRNKHAIWQRLTFRKITRLCQSKSQLDILREMGQKSFWLGLPISKTVNLTQESEEPVFIFCSEQFSDQEAKSVIPYLYGRILAKKSLDLSKKISFPENLKVDLVDSILIPSDFLNVQAFVIALNSSVRGTGWYNEAIVYGIPLIITSAGQQHVFETTYPEYPFIKGNALKSSEDLMKQIVEIKKFDNANYVKKYTKDLQFRLENLLNYKEG